MPEARTRDEILKIARALLASEGLSGISFDAIARRLGRSKQAVLYWYPTKHELLSAMLLPCLEAEADAAERSVQGLVGRNTGIAAYVRAIAAFHLGDLDRFRLMYLLAQTMPANAQDPRSPDLLDRIHPLTDRVYGALAAHLEGDATSARREAVAIHSAVLGLVLLHGLADSVNDPLKHGPSDLIEALIGALRS